MRTTPRSRAQRGFTILEIVIVFILLAGIMAFVGPKIFEKMGQAKSAEQRIRTQTLVGNIEMYRLQVGKYPENAWGNDYRYAVPGQGKAFDLISLGADGQVGGEGENRDVTN
jgi:general secretion pathway protein G